MNISEYGEPDEKITIFDGVYNLRVYGKYGTLVHADNVEIILHPNKKEGTLHIYVWKKRNATPSLSVESREQDKEVEAGGPSQTSHLEL